MRLENLRESYLHDLSVYGREAWLAKHRGYARAEALQLRAGAEEGAWRRLFSAEALARRRALKRLSFALPWRPAFRFTYQYVLRGGFLDGGPGLALLPAPRALRGLHRGGNCEIESARRPG